MEPPISRSASSLENWKANKERFPGHATVAIAYLPAPCTSIENERLFSTASNIAYFLRLRIAAKNKTKIKPAYCMTTRQVQHFLHRLNFRHNNTLSNLEHIHELYQHRESSTGQHVWDINAHGTHNSLFTKMYYSCCSLNTPLKVIWGSHWTVQAEKTKLHLNLTHTLMKNSPKKHESSRVININAHGKPISSLSERLGVQSAQW